MKLNTDHVSWIDNTKNEKMKKISILVFILIVICSESIIAQKHINQNLFRQLTEELPTPNSFRTATGRPGPDYFQQQVDYVMDIILDETAKSVSGQSTITYHNNSPETLTYLWLQLDQNIREQDSFRDKIKSEKLSENIKMATLKQMNNDFDGGFKIAWIKDSKGDALKTIKIAEQMKKTILGVIVTRVKKNDIEMQPDSVKELLEIPILGMIPEDINVQKAISMKDAVMHTHPKSNASRAYKEIAAKLMNVNYDSKKDKEKLWEKLFRKKKRKYFLISFQ